jgi:hypothetical protein
MAKAQPSVEVPADMPLEIAPIDQPSVEVPVVTPPEPEAPTAPAVEPEATTLNLNDYINAALDADLQAKAAHEAAKQAWNQVFFTIKALKSSVATNHALRESKLGALLERLP